jgi:hypothetical protein
VVTGKEAGLAGAFADVLVEYLTDEEFAEMKRRNAVETNESVCHSHDFCDANMAMEDAFRRTFGRLPDVTDKEDGSEGDDVALWNAAWDLAKRGWLTA